MTQLCIAYEKMDNGLARAVQPLAAVHLCFHFPRAFICAFLPFLAPLCITFDAQRARAAPEHNGWSGKQQQQQLGPVHFTCFQWWPVDNLHFAPLSLSPSLSVFPLLLTSQWRGICGQHVCHTFVVIPVASFNELERARPTARATNEPNFFAFAAGKSNLRD